MKGVPVDRGEFRVLGMIPTLLLAALSEFTCALCLTAYAGVLSSLGVGVVATDTGLIGLAVALVAVGTGSVGWSTRRHGQIGPLTATIIGAVVVATARLVAAGSGWSVLSSGVMIGGSVWNVWLGRWRLTGAITQR